MYNESKKGDMDLIGDRLKQLRSSQGVTQDDLAIAINVSRQSIGNYENYSVYPDLDTLVKIADFFNVSTDYLLGRTDHKYNINLMDSTSKEFLEQFFELIKNFEILKK